LFPSGKRGRRPGPANVTANDSVFLRKVGDCPANIFHAESTVFPVGQRFLRAKAIQVNRHVNIGSIGRIGKALEFFPPVRVQNRTASRAVLCAPIIGPRMYFQPPGTLGSIVAENPPGPPALEVAATPDAHLFDFGQLEGAIHPAAASPFRRSDIPIGMVIKRNDGRWAIEPPEPERGEVMEIARAINDEGRETRTGG